MKIKQYLMLLFIPSMLVSCNDVLDIDPPTSSLTADATYSSIGGIEAAHIGLYTGNFHNNPIYYQYLDVYLSMFSDDMKHRLNSWSAYYANEYTTQNSVIGYIWSYAYSSIYQSNDFISRLSSSDLLSESTKNQYIGEAYWFRAYDYLLLVNLFGDVPKVTSTTYDENSTSPRTPKSEIFDLIISDLQQSQKLLESSTEGNTRVTADAATALLARAYLHAEQWDNAVAEASKLIPTDDKGSGTKYKLAEFSRIYKANSSETILQSNQSGFGGSDTYVGYTRPGILFIPYTTRANYLLSDALVADIRSDSSDLRNDWVGVLKSGSTTYYYPYKYKNDDTPSSSDDYEYLIFLRLTEQYLIRAEAYARLGNCSDAVNDINRVRKRAGQGEFASSDKDEILLEIETQRRKEFFSEQAFRWIDLNRTGRADVVYPSTGYKVWEPYKKLLPIPYNEIGRNTNLTQNQGYDEL